MQVKAWSFSFETGGLSVPARGKRNTLQILSFWIRKRSTRTKNSVLAFLPWWLDVAQDTPAKDALPVYEQKKSCSSSVFSVFSIAFGIDGVSSSRRASASARPLRKSGRIKCRLREINFFSRRSCHKVADAQASPYCDIGVIDVAFVFKVHICCVLNVLMHGKLHERSSCIVANC